MVSFSSMVMQFGQRDKQETVHYGSQQIADTDIHAFELATIQQTGVEKSTHQAFNIILYGPRTPCVTMVW